MFAILDLCLTVIRASACISRAWPGKSFLDGDIILVLSGPCIGLTPSSLRHPGSLGNKAVKLFISNFRCSQGSLIILRIRMIVLILSNKPGFPASLEPSRTSLGCNLLSKTVSIQSLLRTEVTFVVVEHVAIEDRHFSGQAW